MAEFDEKLNEILGNPEAMSQIMHLAQSLGGASGETAPTPPSQPASAASPPPANPLNGLDPQLLSKFLPLIKEFGGQQDSNAKTLLYALQPYLKPERQNKVERALQLARLFHVGKSFLAGWGK